jgi:folate-binding protein YgfZ
MDLNLPNPLRHLHDQAEAEYQAYGPIDIVSTFGQPQAEYAAIRKACGMMDLPQRAIIELTGKDRASFLNNLVSNQTFDKQAKTPLEAGRVVYAFLLNTKGRITLDLNVIALDDRMWLEIDARLVQPTLATLDRYLFADQVKLLSRADDLHLLALHGPGASAVLHEASGGLAPALEPMRAAPVTLLGRPVTIWRDDHCGVPGYHLAAAPADAVILWTSLQANFGAVGDIPGQRRLRAVGWAAYNACRIEGGRALFGIDFDDSVLPAETGLLDRAVSFTKGCYVGQEIVARMHARSQLARKLVGIRMESDALPIAGAKIYDHESNEIGGITSSTLSPLLSNTALCLGYVRKPLFAEGSELQIPAEGALRKGTVTKLPFIQT